LISQADNAGNIFFRGSYKRDQLSDVFSEIDILIVPSIWYENAPLVIWEAFATKTPVIATNLGGMSEVVVHDVNGLLFERGNIDDLARQLNRVTEENGLLEKLSTGIPPVKSIKQEVDELENIYEELVNRVLQSID
jgi:glycosyltransferase involved in cell wall biosynthesis